MKKYFIVDEDGTKHEVNEVDSEEEVIETAKTEEIVPETTKDEPSVGLSDEEIASLRKLIPVADKLLALLEPEQIGDEDEEKADEDEEDESDETIVDTDEEGCTAHDSANAIEKQTSVNDSVDVQEEIAEAWRQRYAVKGGRDE